MLSELLVLLTLLIMSAFFASSELAYVVANKIKIEIRARKKIFSARIARYFVVRPNIFFSTILIANNIINITFASILTVFIGKYYHFPEVVILIISSVLLLIFGELIPKYFAREQADRYINFAVVPIRAVAFLLYPLVKIVSSISNFLTRSENVREEVESHFFERSDIEELLAEGSKAGSVAEDESDIITKIIDLGKQKNYETMTPRTDLVGVEISSGINKVIQTFIESGFSKLPVYSESLDNIVGLVYSYDMFRNPQNLNEVIRDAFFVPETKKSLDMLNEFTLRGVSIAIVVDEFGGTAGVVTVEDIVEEMFGEIQDEFDVDDEICSKVKDNTYIISGKVEIDHINEKFDLNLPEGDYETIAGFITSSIGRIPEKSEHFKLNNFDIHILRSDKTKIDLVKLQPITKK